MKLCTPGLKYPCVFSDTTVIIISLTCDYVNTLCLLLIIILMAKDADVRYVLPKPHHKQGCLEKMQERENGRTCFQINIDLLLL